MPGFKDITGNRYGRLVAVRVSGKSKHNQRIWECRCDCGKTHYTLLQSLSQGLTKSCGCLNDEVRKQSMVGNQKAKTHGLSKHPLYDTWSTMKQRCTNPNNAKYYLYGGRGISFDHSWNSFENFLNDMGERPEGTTLDRLDNSLGYCKENCRWATPSDQNRNRRPYKRSPKQQSTGLFNEIV